jgi:glutathione S-transferase
MKLYEYEAFPNPRRVRMFLAEKGVEVERVQVDVPAGEHRGEAFRTLNPDATVPCLELDDGSVISGCVAISRYVEETNPEGALMGTTPAEAARITMTQRRMEDGLMDASTTYYHHATEGLGELEPYQIKEWGLKNAERVTATIERLETDLLEQDYVAGNHFTIADITAFVGYSFAKYVGLADKGDTPNIDRWFAAISARSSAAA